jgi:arylsulfatase
LSGAKYPADAPPVEGKSLVPAFADKPIDRDALYWEHEGNRAVRAGDWKLVAKHGQPWELYDISKDRVEANDLASKMPDKVKELSAKYDGYAKRALVEPWPVAAPKKKKDKE